MNDEMQANPKDVGHAAEEGGGNRADEVVDRPGTRELTVPAPALGAEGAQETAAGGPHSPPVITSSAEGMIAATLAVEADARSDGKKQVEQAETVDRSVQPTEASDASPVVARNAAPVGAEADEADEPMTKTDEPMTKVEGENQQSLQAKIGSTGAESAPHSDGAKQAEQAAPSMPADVADHSSRPEESSMRSRSTISDMVGSGGDETGTRASESKPEDPPSGEAKAAAPTSWGKQPAEAAPAPQGHGEDDQRMDAQVGDAADKETDDGDDSDSDSGTDSDSEGGEDSRETIQDSDEEERAKEHDQVEEWLRDEDADDEDGAQALAPARTKNELLPGDIGPVEKLRVKLEESVCIQHLGKVTAVVEGLAVVESVAQPEFAALDEGSILCEESREPLGTVFETFGPVANPFYTFRVHPDDAERVRAGKDICFVREKAAIVEVDRIRTRGCDASNIYDEEVALDEQEYSDDEEESRVKKGNKASKRRAAEARPTPENEEGGERNRRSRPHPGRNRPAGRRHDGARPQAPVGGQMRPQAHVPYVPGPAPFRPHAPHLQPPVGNPYAMNPMVHGAMQPPGPYLPPWAVQGMVGPPAFAVPRPEGHLNVNPQMMHAAPPLQSSGNSGAPPFAMLLQQQPYQQQVQQPQGLHPQQQLHPPQQPQQLYPRPPQQQQQDQQPTTYQPPGPFYANRGWPPHR